jgi:hypothetical protein
VVSGCGVVGWGKQTDMLHRARSEKSGESIEQSGQCRSVQVRAVEEWSWRHRRCMAIRGSGSLQYQSFGQIIVRDRLGIEPNRMKYMSEVRSPWHDVEVRSQKTVFFVAEANWRVCCCVFCSPNER